MAYRATGARLFCPSLPLLPPPYLADSAIPHCRACTSLASFTVSSTDTLTWSDAHSGIQLHLYTIRTNHRRRLCSSCPSISIHLHPSPSARLPSVLLSCAISFTVQGCLLSFLSSHPALAATTSTFPLPRQTPLGTAPPPHQYPAQYHKQSPTPRLDSTR